MNLLPLDLSDNLLHLPAPLKLALSFQLGGLLLLMAAALVNNLLTGAIPTELGLLTQFEHLYLGWNQLTGVGPGELCRLKDLEMVGFYVDCLEVNCSFGCVRTEDDW
jgi:hypothetical protein